MSDRFAVVAAAQCGASLAGTGSDHGCESRIASVGPQHGLAQSRHSEYRDALTVDFRVRLKIIEGAAQPPTPRRDRSPFVRRRLRLSRLQIERTNSIGQAAVEVWLNVDVVDGRETEARFKQRQHAYLAERSPLLSRHSPVIAVPDFALFHSRVIDSGGVSCKTNIQQQGRRPLRFRRKVNK